MAWHLLCQTISCFWWTTVLWMTGYRVYCYCYTTNASIYLLAQDMELRHFFPLLCFALLLFCICYELCLFSFVLVSPCLRKTLAILACVGLTCFNNNKRHFNYDEYDNSTTIKRRTCQFARRSATRFPTLGANHFVQTSDQQRTHRRIRSRNV